ncbi:MAG: GNAT family N-acetyltransferase [Caldilineaceae bacterium]
MIRKLTASDRAAAVTLLTRAPHLNLYMLGNLETLGFEREFCEFWGDVSATGAQNSLRAILNRYMTGWTIYGQPDAAWSALGAVLDQHPAGATRLQDNPGGIISFLPYLQRYQSGEVKIEEVMNLQAGDFRPIHAPDQAVIRRATLDDLPRLVEFYADAGDMRRDAAAIERPLRDTRLWLAETGQTVVATALTNAESSTLAMIGGVYTTPTQRGQGFSQAVCSALCAELLADGKQPVLYWITPAAGAVYRKLGFRACGQWRSVWLRGSAYQTK